MFLASVVWYLIVYSIGNCLGEGVAEARPQPLLVVRDLAVLRVLRCDEIADHVDDQSGGGSP